jgi:hypothetical protein
MSPRVGYWRFQKRGSGIKWKAAALIKEADELTAIFVASEKTAKRNQSRSK